MKTALDRSISPFLIYGEDDRLIYANQAARESWPELVSGVEQGLSRLEAVREQIRAIAPGLPKELFDAEVQRTMQMFVTKEPTDLGGVDNRWFRTTHHTLEGGIIAGMAVDVTEHRILESKLKKARTEAEQASQAKSEFLANMSHEIRTPMNGILGMAEILKGHDLSEETGELVKIIERSGQALLSIINDILDFSKLEAGQMVVDPAPFSLRDCIEDITLLLSESALRSNIDLKLDYAPDCPTEFIGDAGRIRQILMNLIGNAIKFTDKGNVFVKVGGCKKGDVFKLKIDVQDTGVGIAEEVLPQIFEKFRQADNTKTRRHGGTGLGLSISKDLAALMGGDITVKSKLGEGSTFRFSLALEEGVAKTDHPTIRSENLTSPQLPKIEGNILIIHKTPEVKAQVQSFASETQSRLIHVESVKKGVLVLKQAQQKNIPLHAILVHEDMPDYSGHDFVDYVRQNMKLDKPPILLISKDETLDVRRQPNQVEANAYLKYSAVKRELENTLRAMLSDGTKKPDAQDGLKTQEAPKITLVPQQKSAPRAETTPAPQGTSAAEGVDILIAEDNDINQMYMKYVMKELGQSYEMAENGKLAVEYWQATKPKLILMDISMPEMTGYEATQAIRAIEKEQNLPRTPIIAVTAHAMKGDADRCLAAGMDDYITKPVSKPLLMEKLKYWSQGESAQPAKSA